MPKTLFDWKSRNTRETMYAQIIRTAEVTICIILERTARSPPTLTVLLELMLLRKFLGVTSQGINVMLIVVPLDIRTEHRFRGPGVPESCRYCRLDLPRWDRANLLKRQGEGLSVVRLQVTKTYRAYALCTIPILELYIWSQFSLTVMTHPTDLYQQSSPVRGLYDIYSTFNKRERKTRSKRKIYTSTTSDGCSPRTRN